MLMTSSGTMFCSVLFNLVSKRFLIVYLSYYLECFNKQRNDDDDDDDDDVSIMSALLYNVI